MTETVVTIETRNPTSGQPKSGGTGNAATTSVGIQFNIGYFKTVPGLLKLAQLVFGIICMACASPAVIGATHYFLFVAVTAFIATILWCFVYLLGIRELLTLPINWIFTELVNTGIETVLYLIAFIVQLAKWSGLSGILGSWATSNIAAGVFGLFNTLVYAAGTYFLYVEHRMGTTQ